MNRLTIVTHFWVGDPDCHEDYCSVTIHLDDGTKIAEWSDHYHDAGLDKAEGFVAGVRWLRGNVEVKEIDVADIDQ